MKRFAAQYYAYDEIKRGLVRCVSVWLAVTFVYYVETAKYTVVVAMECE